MWRSKLYIYKLFERKIINMWIIIIAGILLITQKNDGSMWNFTPTGRKMNISVFLLHNDIKTFILKKFKVKWDKYSQTL